MLCPTFYVRVVPQGDMSPTLVHGAGAAYFSVAIVTLWIFPLNENGDL